MTELLQVLQYDFVRRALLTGSLLVICAALLGNLLLSKKMAILSYTLSNIAFLGTAVAYVFNLPSFICSLPLVALSSFVLVQQPQATTKKQPKDAILVLTANVALAAGICLIAYVSGMSLDICNFMFGSVLIVNGGEMLAIIFMCLIILFTFIHLHPYIFAWQLDSGFYRQTRLLPPTVNLIVTLLLSFLLAAGLKLLGTLLLSALLILPPLSANLITRSLRMSYCLSVLLALGSFAGGMAISYAFSLPSGAAIVTVQALIYLLLRGSLSLLHSRKRRHTALLVIVAGLLLNLSACAGSGRQNKVLTDYYAAEKKEQGAKMQANGEARGRRLGADSKNELRTEHLASGQAADGSEYLPIPEKQFVLLTNEIYANYKQYMDKTIAMEGIFVILEDKKANKPRYFVIRYGPGCCAYDGMPGFEVVFPADYEVDKLKENDWLYVEGKLKVSRENSIDYLYLELSKIETGRPYGLSRVIH